MNKVKTVDERLNGIDFSGNRVDVSTEEFAALNDEASELRAAYEALQKENTALKESNLELERLCDRTYVKQGADAYNHCCEVFEAWRVKRQKLDLPTHDWADGLYNSLNWLQDTVEELETESAAQAKRIAELESEAAKDHVTILRLKDALSAYGDPDIFADDED